MDMHFYLEWCSYLKGQHCFEIGHVDDVYCLMFMFVLITIHLIECDGTGCIIHVSEVNCR